MFFYSERTWVLQVILLSRKNESFFVYLFVYLFSFVSVWLFDSIQFDWIEETWLWYVQYTYSVQIIRRASHLTKNINRIWIGLCLWDQYSYRGASFTNISAINSNKPRKNCWINDTQPQKQLYKKSFNGHFD